MHWKETGGVEKLFSLPGRPLHSQVIFKGYQVSLTSVAADDEVFGLLGDSERDNIQLEVVPGEQEDDGQPVVRRGPGRPPKRKLDGEAPAKKAPRKEAAAAAIAEKSQHQQRADDMAALATQQPGFDQFQQQSDLFQQNDSSGQLENHGYDPNNPNMSNMGWDSQSHGAPTPGPPSMGAPTPYRDDDDNYYNPASIGANKEDEVMGEDETIEEYEDRVLNKRAAHLNTILKYGTHFN